ncbi:hypothetical protein Rsub_02444 [Raphidocelis subcapitata]|uniref:Uncharacterized protein n=1 Tax=Raphidocelis subcapitata TaxID=307507 RepID=A0A2V0NRN8_9CHLO|nr:hypothetical protein Rsub_02444 [Raphidocelis subcapitata]|eukprot:GBF90338.1 hypothetical protein Rsub_02444 [Raphidocelis subcapitata]
MYDAVRISRLSRELRQRGVELARLQAHNLDLKARAMVMVLLRRVLFEVAQHKSRFGADASPELSQLESLYGSGGDAAATASADPERLLAGLAHLGPERSLFGLESVTLLEVSAARDTSFESVASTLGAIVSQGRPHLQRLLSTLAPDGERAAAEARLAACGAGILRLHNLLVIWNAGAYIESCYRKYDDGHYESAGPVDVPSGHWDRVLASTGLAREQALLLLANWELQNERLAGLRLRRAELSALLSAGSDSGGSGGGTLPSRAPINTARPAQAPGADVAAAAGAALPPPSTAAQQQRVQEEPAEGGALPEELVEELAIVGRCERETLLLHAMIDQAIMTNVHRAAAMCASFPYPLDGAGVRAAIKRAIEGGGGGLPWAGLPWEITNRQCYLARQERALADRVAERVREGEAARARGAMRELERARAEAAEAVRAAAHAQARAAALAVEVQELKAKLQLANASKN